MAAQFDSNPAETYMPVNQILIYTISDDGGAVAAAHRFIVQVFENATEVAKLYLTANTNSKALFDLSAFAKESVKVDSNDYAQAKTIHEIADVDYSKYGTRKFQVKVGTYDGTSETLAEATKSIYLVDGAFSVMNGQTPLFTNFYPTSAVSPYKKVWLTDRWADKKMVANTDCIDYYFDDDASGVAAWIHDSNVIGGTDLNLNFSIYQDSHQIATEDVDIVTAGGLALTATDYDKKIHYVGIAPKSLSGWVSAANLPSANSLWTHYTIHLLSSRNQVSKYLRIHRDCLPTKHARVYLAYANKVGGWDYITFDSKTEKTETVENKTYLKQLGDWDASTFSYLKSARTKQAYQITASNKYTLKGLGFNPEEYTLLESLLRSDNVMIKYGDKFTVNNKILDDRNLWLPVTVNTKSLVIRDEHQTKLFDVTLDVELAQEIRC